MGERMFTITYVSGGAGDGPWSALPDDGVDEVHYKDIVLRGHGIYFYNGTVLGGGTVGDAYGAGCECIDLVTGLRYYLEGLPDLRIGNIKLGAWRPATISTYVTEPRAPGDTWWRRYMCCRDCGKMSTIPVDAVAVKCGHCGMVVPTSG